MDDVKQARRNMEMAQTHLATVLENAQKGKFPKVATHVALALFHLGNINLEKIAWDNCAESQLIVTEYGDEHDDTKLS